MTYFMETGIILSKMTLLKFTKNKYNISNNSIKCVFSLIRENFSILLVFKVKGRLIRVFNLSEYPI